MKTGFSGSPSPMGRRGRGSRAVREASRSTSPVGRDMMRGLTVVLSWALVVAVCVWVVVLAVTELGWLL